MRKYSLILIITGLLVLFILVFFSPAAMISAEGNLVKGSSQKHWIRAKAAEQQPRPDLTPDEQERNTPRDVFFLLDATATFKEELAYFQDAAPGLLEALQAEYTDIRFGMGRFEDYPILPFGYEPSGDRAYLRLVDLNLDKDAMLSSLKVQKVRSGLDVPESQLTAVYQAATGEGQDLADFGYTEASIIPGQQANFREDSVNIIVLWTDAPFHQPGDEGAIGYPGNSFAETINAVRQVCRCKVVGVYSRQDETLASAAKTREAETMRDMNRLVRGSGAFAVGDGVDCDGDGSRDIPPGKPLVCTIAGGGQGVDLAMSALIKGVPVPQNTYLPAIRSQ